MIHRMYVHEDIITDKLRLTQVLLNISGNAVKVYTGWGYGIAFVFLSSHAEETDVRRWYSV